MDEMVGGIGEVVAMIALVYLSLFAVYYVHSLIIKLRDKYENYQLTRRGKGKN